MGQAQPGVAEQFACISTFARALWIARYLFVSFAGLAAAKAVQSFCGSGPEKTYL